MVTEPQPEEEFPTRIAGALESVADTARSLTVDKAANVIKWAALAIVLAALGLAALIFFLIGLFRILGEVLGNQEIAYAVVGGLFLIVVALLLRFRSREPEIEELDV